MTHSLETKIQVLILITKYKSSVTILGELQRQRTTNLTKRHATTSIYLKPARLETLLIQENLQQANYWSIVF